MTHDNTPAIGIALSLVLMALLASSCQRKSNVDSPTAEIPQILPLIHSETITGGNDDLFMPLALNPVTNQIGIDFGSGLMVDPSTGDMVFGLPIGF